LSDAMELGLVFSTNLERDRGAIYVDDIGFSESVAVEAPKKFASTRTDKALRLTAQQRAGT